MKAISGIFIAAIIFLFSASCNNRGNEVDVTVKNTEMYVYDFGICGDEEGASIYTQASHFEICEILRDSTTQFCVIMHYKPAAGYTGSDVIEVQTNTGSNGAGNGKIDYIKFNITVTN